MTQAIPHGFLAEIRDWAAWQNLQVGFGLVVPLPYRRLGAKAMQQKALASTFFSPWSIPTVLRELPFYASDESHSSLVTQSFIRSHFRQTP